MHKLLNIFWLGGESHSQKTSKSGGFFPENHCRAPPRGGVIYSSFWTQKRCRIFKKSPKFFRMHKFLKIFSLGGENHSQKTSKSGGFFSWKSLPLERKASRYNEKPQKTTNLSKNLQKLFKKHKSLNFLCDIAEWPMVSLGQEPLGGANHSQKTSKSGGVFPANHLL